MFANIENIRNNTLLFCLKKTEKPLTINKYYKGDKNIIKTNSIPLNNFLEELNILNIEPWLPGATESDNDGNIYLNRIYRITFDNKEIFEIQNIKQSLESLHNVYSSEFEYKLSKKEKKGLLKALFLMDT